MPEQPEADTGLRLDDVRRLQLAPGDILAITTQSDHFDVVQEIADYVDPIVAEHGARAILLPPGTEITVLRPDSEVLREQIREELRNEIQRAATRVPTQRT